MEYRIFISIVDISANLENLENMDIDIDKAILKNINIDIQREILENIDIDIDKDILENIDIDKEILENIDIDKISISIRFWHIEQGYSFSNIAQLMPDRVCTLSCTYWR